MKNCDCFSSDKFATVYACKNGHLKCLEEALCDKHTWYPFAAAYAAQNGHLDCLIYIHSNGYEWDENTAVLAAECPNVEILKYVLLNGCPHNEFVCCSAIEKGLMENLKFAYEFGCAYDEVLCSYLLETRYAESLDLNYARVSLLPCFDTENKFLKMIKYMRERGKGCYKFNCNQLGIHNTKKLKFSSKKPQKLKVIFDCCAYCKKLNNVYLNENIIL